MEWRVKLDHEHVLTVRCGPDPDYRYEIPESDGAPEDITVLGMPFRHDPTRDHDRTRSVRPGFFARLLGAEPTVVNDGRMRVYRCTDPAAAPDRPTMNITSDLDFGCVRIAPAPPERPTCEC